MNIRLVVLFCTMGACAWSIRNPEPNSAAAEVTIKPSSQYPALLSDGETKHAPAVISSTSA